MNIIEFIQLQNILFLHNNHLPGPNYSLFFFYEYHILLPNFSMVIHLLAKVFHNNTLGLSPQSKNHQAIVCLSLLCVTFFNKQNIKPTKQSFSLPERHMQNNFLQRYLQIFHSPLHHHAWSIKIFYSVIN
jgi:hypothetical protein